MKRLLRQGDLKGKTIKFKEDVEYGKLEWFNSNNKNSFSGGITFDKQMNESMNQYNFDLLTEYLKSIGFIKGENIIIPAGTVATVTYDNAGNDVDLKIDDRLEITMVNTFVFDNAKDNKVLEDDDILVEIVE